MEKRHIMWYNWLIDWLIPFAKSSSYSYHISYHVFAYNMIWSIVDHRNACIHICPATLLSSVSLLCFSPLLLVTKYTKSPPLASPVITHRASRITALPHYVKNVHPFLCFYTMTPRSSGYSSSYPAQSWTSLWSACYASPASVAQVPPRPPYRCSPHSRH